ncbi:MAG: integrase [Tardiphaga sp.]
MATMVTKVYDALKDAGASEEKARAAATAMAMHEPRCSAMASDIKLLQWMLGFDLAFTVAIAVKLFLPWPWLRSCH